MYWRIFVLICMIVAGVVSADSADARTQTLPDPHTLTSIVESAPTLAPFQHVRFCLRYPAECKPSSAAQRIELDVQTMQLLDRVNRDVNLSITPMVKAYDADLADGWTIGPDSGDCNDYAVTKRHNLIARGAAFRGAAAVGDQNRFRNWPPRPGRRDDQRRHGVGQPDFGNPPLADH